MDEILEICHNILVQTPGVSRVILADKTGLTLANLSRFDFDLRDVEALGAISSAVYLASETQGSNVGFVEMTMLVAEFKGGKIMVASCGSAVLCVITDNDVALGMARMTINQAAKKIELLLEERMDIDIGFESVEEMLPSDLEKTATSEPVEDEFLADLQNALKELEQF
jgi:predicted regulator of Ras-like GTPase activity (Roadblock/LC7/MglB family)